MEWCLLLFGLFGVWVGFDLGYLWVVFYCFACVLGMWVTEVFGLVGCFSFVCWVLGYAGGLLGLYIRFGGCFGGLLVFDLLICW